MAKNYFTKSLSGLHPADENAESWYRKIKTGETVSLEGKKVRNYRFLKKYFALLNLAYGYWEPGEISSKYGKPEKNFERFRKDLVILAGYSHIVIRLDGSTRIEADSISFGKMDSDTFDSLYNNVLNVVLKRIPVLDKLTAPEIDKLVDKVLTFA